MSVESAKATQAGTTRVQQSLALAMGVLPALFLLITSTTHLVEDEFAYDIKRLLQLCLLLLLFAAAVLNSALRASFALQFDRIPAWVKALFGSIIVLGIISSGVHATSALHLAYSLLEVTLLSMLVLAVLVIAACRSIAGRPFDIVAVTLLALTAIAVGIQELVGVAAVLASGLEFHSHISLIHYSFPRFYNQVQGWTLPVIAALPLLWSRSRSQLLRSPWFQAVAVLAALALHWHVILTSGGRGVAVGLFASFIVCLAIIPWIRRPSLRWHLTGLALGAALFFVIAQIHHEFLGPDGPQSPQSTASATNPQAQNENRFAGRSLTGRLNLHSTGRWHLWRRSVDDIKAHPLLGNGPMNYACTGTAFRAAHPHNFLLQFAGEWGLAASLALAAIIGFVLASLWRAIRTPHLPHELLPVAGLLTAGLLAAAGHSFFSGVLVMPASQTAGILIGGWLMGMIPVEPRTKPMRSVPAAPVLITGIVLCSLTTAFSFSEARHREYREGFLPAIDQMIPRYWQQGKLCKYLDDFQANASGPADVIWYQLPATSGKILTNFVTI